jgi:ParB/RepB/Spo0J family partition protein
MSLPGNSLHPARNPDISWTMEEVEISQIDTSLERIRIRDKAAEKALLDSILEGGIREPLKCASPPHGRLILLDGFKRLRCAAKLGIRAMPVISLGSDEPTAILHLLRLSNARTLSTLEQAALVDELHQAHQMSVSQIAHHLERSPAWVSLRLGLIGEMSETVKEAIFAGRFPLRSYMYSLRSFTRVKRIKKSEVDTFVKSVSGKSLSIRTIEVLAQGFFNGGPAIREQITHGNLDWTLNQLKQQPANEPPSFNEWESRTLKGLELAQGCMVRIPRQLRCVKLKSQEFFAEAELLTEGILSRIDFFTKALRWFHDRRREKKSDSSALWGREKEETDCPAS